MQCAAAGVAIAALAAGAVVVASDAQATSIGVAFTGHLTSYDDTTHESGPPVAFHGTLSYDTDVPDSPAGDPPIHLWRFPIGLGTLRIDSDGSTVESNPSSASVTAVAIPYPVDEFGDAVDSESPDFVYYATLLTIGSSDLLLPAELGGVPVASVTLYTRSPQPDVTFELPRSAEDLASLLAPPIGRLSGTGIELVPTAGKVRFLGTLENVTPIPEPSSATLVALGLSLLSAGYRHPR